MFFIVPTARLFRIRRRIRTTLRKLRCRRLPSTVWSSFISSGRLFNWSYWPSEGNIPGQHNSLIVRVHLDDDVFSGSDSFSGG